MRTRKKDTPWKMIMRIKNVDKAFDFFTLNVYITGQFGNQIPVDESRAFLVRLKKLLSKETKE